MHHSPRKIHALILHSLFCYHVYSCFCPDRVSMYKSHPSCLLTFLHTFQIVMISFYIQLLPLAYKLTINSVFIKTFTWFHFALQLSSHVFLFFIAELLDKVLYPLLTKFFPTILSCIYCSEGFPPFTVHWNCFCQSHQRLSYCSFHLPILMLFALPVALNTIDILFLDLGCFFFLFLSFWYPSFLWHFWLLHLSHFANFITSNS